jgi:hypothetical protein
LGATSINTGKPKNFLIIFFKGQMINEHYYREVQPRLSKQVHRKHPEQLWNQDWLKHHYNAPVHTFFSAVIIGP